VVANDFLRFAYHISHATIENNHTRLGPQEVDLILRRNSRADTFIRDTFRGLYFTDEDNAFLDQAYANIARLDSEYQRSLALAALCRACMKKRPRGIFTFTGRKGWDGRRDLTLSMKEQFLEAVEAFNAAVFDNGRDNRALCLDVFELPSRGADLVYIDTPYLSPHSDSDYTRRYHFVEGLCSYWQSVDIQFETQTKKIKSLPTAFSSVKTAETAFGKLFNHFAQAPILAVSYSSNGVPSRKRIVEMLRSCGRSVRVAESRHKYCFGNQAHKVGDNKNDVTEYLFIAAKERR
jgi:DNA adenine methylase